MASCVTQVVFEAPPGLKKNLQRTYTLWSTDYLAGNPVAGAVAAAGGRGTGGYEVAAVPAALVPLRAQLLFLLAWFNAVVQERRNFVPYVSSLCWWRDLHKIISKRSQLVMCSRRSAADTFEAAAVLVWLLIVGQLGM